MADRTLTQRLGTAAVGLGMLVQSILPSAALGIECTKDGKFYNKRTEQYEVCRPLPDVSGCKPLWTKKYDMLNSIPGQETTVKGYQCEDKRIVIFSLPNEKIYGFGVKDSIGSNEYWDYENDGNFEQASKKFKIETNYYGY